VIGRALGAADLVIGTALDLLNVNASVMDGLYAILAISKSLRTAVQDPRMVDQRRTSFVTFPLVARMIPRLGILPRADVRAPVLTADRTLGSDAPPLLNVSD
jgi:hypothetical protein